MSFWEQDELFQELGCHLFSLFHGLVKMPGLGRWL
jgi:hypothetical protein